MHVIDALLNYEDTSLPFNREVSCFATPKHGVISMTSNDTSGAVNFGWDSIWGFIKTHERDDELVMIHTHPYGMVDMSSIDRNMVQGWRLALGVPIKFYVATQYIITKYICDRDKDRKMYITDADYKNIRVVSPDLMIISRIMYGMSKADELTEKNIDAMKFQLKYSDLRF